MAIGILVCLATSTVKLDQFTTNIPICRPGPRRPNLWTLSHQLLALLFRIHPMNMSAIHVASKNAAIASRYAPAARHSSRFSMATMISRLTCSPGTANAGVLCPAFFPRMARPRAALAHSPLRRAASSKFVKEPSSQPRRLRLLSSVDAGPAVGRTPHKRLLKVRLKPRWPLHGDLRCWDAAMCTARWRSARAAAASVAARKVASRGRSAAHIFSSCLGLRVWETHVVVAEVVLALLRRFQVGEVHEHRAGVLRSKPLLELLPEARGVGVPAGARTSEASLR